MGEHQADPPAPAHDEQAPVLVSACLLGVRCAHDGEGNLSPAVVELGRQRRLVPICPEVAGGLPTPRPPAEIQADGSVRTEAGHDVTELYRRGATAALALARATGCTEAVLKARSPSCGSREIYDGTFSRGRIPGAGITTGVLREAGISVRSEEDVALMRGTSLPMEPT